MHNELFTIGPVTVYGYGLMIAIGIFMAYLTAEYRSKKLGLQSELVFSIVVYGVVSGFLGSKILYFLTILPQIIEDPSLLTQLSDGWVVYGGILGGILGAYIYLCIKKQRFIDYFDMAMPSVALAQGFGRIGCFLAGCCYGEETDSIFSVTFHTSEYAPNDVALVPTQLLSSGLNFIHFFVLFWIAKHTKRRGVVGGCYLVFYSVGRFIIEFFRGDLNRGAIGVLSTSQFIALFVFAAGIILLVWAFRQEPKEEVTYGGKSVEEKE